MAAVPVVGEARRERWERAVDWPLILMALIFLAAYAWPILRDVGLQEPWMTICRVVTLTAWASFALDYVVRFALSVNRRLFVRSNPIDLAVVLLPLLRPLPLLRLVTLLSVVSRYAGGGSLRGRVAIYVAGSTALVLFVAALAVLDAERGRLDSNIATFGDAFWWHDHGEHRRLRGPLPGAHDRAVCGRWAWWPVSRCSVL